MCVSACFRCFVGGSFWPLGVLQTVSSINMRGWTGVEVLFGALSNDPPREDQLWDQSAMFAGCLPCSSHVCSSRQVARRESARRAVLVLVPADVMVAEADVLEVPAKTDHGERSGGCFPLLQGLSNNMVKQICVCFIWIFIFCMFVCLGCCGYFWTYLGMD